MQLRLKRPDLEKFIDDQVKAGHFPSPGAAVEAAVEQMMLDQQPVNLTEDDLRAIAESDAQIARGEVIDFDTFAAAAKKKYHVKPS